MPIINGEFYEGNVTIINGKVVKGKKRESKEEEKVTFDQRKTEIVEDGKNIVIKGNVPIYVMGSDSDEVEAHLYGTSTSKEEPKLSIQKIENDILIQANEICQKQGRFEANEVCHKQGQFVFATENSVVNIINNNVVGITNIDKGRLRLDVRLPKNRKLFVEGENSVTITSSVKSEFMKIENVEGNIHIASNFQDLEASSRSGEIVVDANQNENAVLKLETRNGGIEVSSKFQYLKASSRNGEIVVGTNQNSKAIIRLETQNGGIEVSSNFEDLRASSQHGTIDVESRLLSDAKLDVSTQMGNIVLELSNIKKSYLSTNTNMGRCRNFLKLGGSYTLSGSAQTKMGNITLY